MPHPEIGDRVIGYDGTVEGSSQAVDSTPRIGQSCVRLRLRTGAKLVIWVLPTSTSGLWRQAEAVGGDAVSNDRSVL
jgi:hypothetical protein